MGDNRTRKKRTSRKPVTPKSLGLVDGVKLSKRYDNSRESFKTVSDIVIGYYVTTGLPVRIAPIYRADIWFRGKVNRIITSHEIDDYYNPARRGDEEPDSDGDALACLAATALGALERHAEREKLASSWAKKQLKSKPPRNTRRNRA
jgi:hypothetical protein